MNSEDHFWRICAAAAFVPLLFGAYSLFEPFGRDQGIHATIAFALQDGLATYRDVYNIKPPMTTATHWLALELFGHSYHAIRILDLLLVSLGMASLAASVMLLGGRAALALGAPVGFAALFYSLGYWEHAQTDGWAALCLIFALNMAALGWRLPPGRRRFILMLLAGAFMGVGFCYKYTIGTVGLLVFAPLLVAGTSVRFHWRDLFWLVSGGLLTLAVVFGILWSNGLLTSFVEIQDFVRGYVSYSHAAQAILLQYFVMVWKASPWNTILLGIGALAFLASALRNWSLLHAVTVIIALVGMISAIVQGKAFTYQYLPVFIASGLLIGWALAEVHEAIAPRLKGKAGPALTWAALIIAVGIGAGALQRSLNQTVLVAAGTLAPRDIAMTHDREGDYSFADLLSFSEQFSEIRNEDESFFLWGYETGLYFLQGMPPRYRYPYSWPFSVSFYDGRYTQDLLERLQSDPPAFFVVQSDDAAPWVTANPDDSRDTLPRLPEIHAFLLNGYEQVLEADRYDLWERKP